MTGRTRDVEVVADARADLGEGPLWDPRAGVLYWLDIFEHRLHGYDPSSGHDAEVKLEGMVNSIGLRASGGLVAATPRGFEALDPATGALELLAGVEVDEPDSRMNDGEVGPDGRFWAGTMVDGVPERGTLYRLDPDLGVVPTETGISISNGIGWSPDGTRMYYVDTPTEGIDVFDYDPARGELSHRRRLVDLPAADYGNADGLTVDAEGFVWVALWGGSAVRRFAPDGGLDLVVETPVSQPTSCAFGGADLGDLYITTARYGKTPEDLDAEPALGGLLRCRPGPVGRAPVPFAG